MVVAANGLLADVGDGRTKVTWTVGGLRLYGRGRPDRHVAKCPPMSPAPQVDAGWFRTNLDGTPVP
jgi:hypothetical protein